MKKPVRVMLLALPFILSASGLYLFGLHLDHVEAQSLTAPARGVGSAQTLATCPTPAAGTTWYCETFTGPYISLNGAAYIPVPLTAAGVTSVQVCNAVGANCGTPQTGSVVLNLVKVATTSATTTLQ